jgi:hypothetical protein
MILPPEFESLVPLFLRHGDTVSVNAQFLDLNMDTLTHVSFYCQIEPDDKWYRITLPKDWPVSDWHVYATLVVIFEELSRACEALGFRQKSE